MLLGIINFSILLIISGIHIYWGLGGNGGLQAAIPELSNKKVMQPGRALTLSVAVIFGTMGLFYLYKIGRFPIADPLVPGWLSQYGLWLLAGIFLLRAIGDFRYVGFFKRIKNSRFAGLDTKFYSPLCLLLSANTFILISFLS